MIENDSKFYYVDGNRKPITNSQNEKFRTIVAKNDFEIPFSAIELYVDATDGKLDKSCKLW